MSRKYRALPWLLVIGAALAVVQVSCLVNSMCVSHDDCPGNEICGYNGECYLECDDLDLANCTAQRPHCATATNRCVECLDVAHCGTNEQCVGNICVPGMAPSFALVDQNPTSPTYGQTLGLDQYSGEVVMLFFAGLG